MMIIRGVWLCVIKQLINLITIEFQNLTLHDQTTPETSQEMELSPNMIKRKINANSLRLTSGWTEFEEPIASRKKLHGKMARLFTLSTWQANIQRHSKWRRKLRLMPGSVRIFGQNFWLGNHWQLQNKQIDRCFLKLSWKSARNQLLNFN